VKYLNKDAVISSDASWLFRATPYLVFASAVLAALLVPVVYVGQGAGFMGDLVVLVYLLGLGRFFTLLSAMDTGSAFTGMGSSREATLSALAEPALLLGLIMAALPSGTFELGSAVHQLVTGAVPLSAVKALSLAALGLVVIVETGRVPVDNPATHLEVTMIHEGLVLEHAGKGLAMMNWGAATKQLLLFTLLIDLFVPWGLATTFTPGALAIALGLYGVKLVGVAVAIGCLESGIAKMRLFQVPDLIGASFVFSVLALFAFTLLG
jgi:formate hydrogenlyase subunit 4